MPDWAVTVIVALVASLPGLASWLKVTGDNKRAKAQEPLQQKQMLQAVADTASATALRCLESATKELHLQLDETRAQGEAQQREIEALTKRLADTERELALVKADLKLERQSNARMAERIRQLEEERAGLLKRIDELEACR
jgi:predicted nuclease with TOPRIM domain